MRRWLRKRPTSIVRAKFNSAQRCRWQSTIDSASRSPENGQHEEQKREREIPPRGRGETVSTKWKPSFSVREDNNDGSTRARHLLRAILRECTYLPDSFARQGMTKHALSRFKTSDFKAWKHREKPDYADRLRAREKDARGWLAYLRRANEGERKCLMRIMFMAYGRIGRRRHELLRPLLPTKGREEIERLGVQQEGGEDADELSSEVSEDASPAESMSITTLGKPAPQKNDQVDTSPTLVFELHLTPQLRALLLSQIQASPPTLTRTNLRRLTQEIPALNTWLRPMPQCRIKNKRKEHYASILSRALPPLPTEEWNHLLALASGQQPIPAPIPRRKPGASTLCDAKSDITVNLRGDNAALETILAYGKPPTKLLHDRNAHAMTPRFMRRLYAQVLSQCPLMEWDREGKEWRVFWGEQALQHVLRLSKRADAGDLGARDMEVSRIEMREEKGGAR